MNNWYEKLFENYAHQYDKESFVHGTSGECDFIESEIGFRKGSKILDIACGTGRHSIELVKRGYNVTGIDLSESQLKRAKEKAQEQNLSIDFQKLDARNLPFSGEFDLAIMICEGAFPLMETDEMNFQILKSASNSLKSNGMLIFTTLNGLFPLFHSVNEFLSSNSDKVNSSYDYTSFDLMTFRFKSVTTFTDDSGKKFDLDCNERYYVPSEITWLLKSLGFRAIDIYGAKLGAFSRNDKLTTDDFEMLVIAEKN
jgi:2-polyprenyl-3-methyl-5-hydroxy-6-metoxy-1,4-benzoquinol methylase